MFNTILIFIMVVVLIAILYKVNKNVEEFINYAKQSISERQEDEDEYEYEENKDDPITDNVIKEIIIDKNKSLEKPIEINSFTIWNYKENIENFKSKSTCAGCRFLEHYGESNGWGEVEHHWYCTEYKEYIVKDHGCLASTVKPICRDNKELKKEYQKLVDKFDEIYNKHINN